jgi:methylated-DNA-[protein]-cysteine S-methyltransferase
MCVAEPLDYAVLPSPAGDLAIAWGRQGIERIWFVSADDAFTAPSAWRQQRHAEFGAGEQLAAYFDGKLQIFDLPLKPRGTQFQLAVWQALLQVPYGTTLSYGGLAAALGQPGSARAVGGANHRNLLPIVIPCHRVVGARGALGGYAGGVRFKRLLLDLELRHSFPDSVLDTTVDQDAG